MVHKYSKFYLQDLRDMKSWRTSSEDQNVYRHFSVHLYLSVDVALDLTVLARTCSESR